MDERDELVDSTTTIRGSQIRSSVLEFQLVITILCGSVQQIYRTNQQ